MATTVHNFGISKEKLEFNSSSKEDMGYAKTFWQSVQLLPPMESRLVSNDISQRLKAAPLGQPIDNKRVIQRDEDPQVLTKFLEKARFEEHMAQRRHFDRLSHFREQDRSLLHKHRNERKMVEQISNHAGLKEPPPPTEPALDDPFLFRDQEEDVKETTLKDIEEFEKLKGFREEAEDSD